MSKQELENLKLARLEKHLSQAELASEIGISQSMYAQIESGNKNANDNSKKKIAQCLESSVGFLFFGEPITNSNNL